MKKLLATILAVAMILSLMPMALGEGAQDPITLTVFRGDPGDHGCDPGDHLSEKRTECDHQYEEL